MGEDLLTQVLTYISIFIGTVASLIIVWGVIVTIKGFIIVELRENRRSEAAESERRNIRHKLGGNLLLGLEVLIAADIIETIANPSLTEIGLLGGIVIIRTFISYFLDRELKDNR